VGGSVDHTSIRQCPFCPLRFAHRTELNWHLDDEHHDLIRDYVIRSQRVAPALEEVSTVRRA
jgi:hypothetical protein